MNSPYRIAAIAAGAVAALLPRASEACPFCDSSISQLVWDGIFTDGFGENMAMSLAPFAVFAVLGVWLHGVSVAGRSGGEHESV